MAINKYNIYNIFRDIDKIEYKILKDSNCIVIKDNIVYLICSCGKKIKIDEKYFLSFLDINYFKWWYYKLDSYSNDKIKTSVSLNKDYKPYNYIAYVPILKEIAYYLHMFFHKPKYIPLIECEKCIDEENGE